MILKSAVVMCNANQEIIEIPNGWDFVVAHEFCIFNQSDVDINIQLNNEGDLLTLSPSEGWRTNLKVTSCIVKEQGAVVKYSYWR